MVVKDVNGVQMSSEAVCGEYHVAVFIIFSFLSFKIVAGGEGGAKVCRTGSLSTPGMDLLAFSQGSELLATEEKVI